MLHSNKSKPKLKASQTITFEAIGTTWCIEIFNTLDDTEPIRSKILTRIDAFDAVYSRFRNDSLVTRMSQTGGKYMLPDDAKALLDFYHVLYELTDGAVTPLIGNVLVEAGYDAEYSLTPKALHSPPSWGHALRYAYPELTIKVPVLLDVGAAGKGYLVDIVGTLLEEVNITDYAINAGGDIIYKTTLHTPLEVALEHPDDPSLAIGVASILNQSICGSAGNRRTWAQFHHILDPRSLTSPQHIKALWVVANSGLVADGLATALFFVTPETLRSKFDFAYAIINADHTLTRSSNFPAVFYNEQD